MEIVLDWEHRDWLAPGDVSFVKWEYNSYQPHGVAIKIHGDNGYDRTWKGAEYYSSAIVTPIQAYTSVKIWKYVGEKGEEVNTFPFQGIP